MTNIYFIEFKNRINIHRIATWPIHIWVNCTELPPDLFLSALAGMFGHPLTKITILYPHVGPLILSWKCQSPPRLLFSKD